MGSFRLCARLYVRRPLISIHLIHVIYGDL